MTRRKEDSPRFERGKYTPSWRKMPDKKKKKKQWKCDIPHEYVDEENYFRCIELLSERAYQYYKDHSKADKKYSIHAFYRVIKFVFKRMKHYLTRNETGIFIKNFGYFFIMMYPKRRVTKYMAMRIKNKGHSFEPMFLPIRKDVALRTWTMRKSFFRSGSLGWYLYSGKKYRMAYTYLNTLYGFKKQNTA